MGQQSSQIQPSQTSPARELSDSDNAHSIATSDNIGRPSQWQPQVAMSSFRALNHINGDSPKISKKRPRSDSSPSNPRKAPKHGPQKLRGTNIQPDFESSANTHVINAGSWGSLVHDPNIASISTTHDAPEISQSPEATRELNADERAERKQRKREKREARRLAKAINGEPVSPELDAEAKAERKRRKREKREARLLAEAGENGQSQAIDADDLAVEEGESALVDQRLDESVQENGEPTIDAATPASKTGSAKKRKKESRILDRVEEQSPIRFRASALAPSTANRTNAEQLDSGISQPNGEDASSLLTNGAHEHINATEPPETPNNNSRKSKKRKTSKPAKKLSADAPENHSAPASEIPPEDEDEDETTVIGKGDKDKPERKFVTKMGPFDEDEKRIADQIFQSTCQYQGLTESELARQLHENWRRIEYFKEDIRAAFLDRDNAAIRKFVLRRYHPHDRGPWSEEQDEELRAAHAKYPGRWVEIAQLVGRHPDSVRDRWRNHLAYGEGLGTGYWEAHEEKKLINVIEGALKIIATEKRNEDLAKLDSLIDWNYVARMMDGTRSRKRCMEKYRLLKEKGWQPGQDGEVVAGSDDPRPSDKAVQSMWERDPKQLGPMKKVRKGSGKPAEPLKITRTRQPRKKKEKNPETPEKQFKSAEFVQLSDNDASEGSEI